MLTFGFDKTYRRIGVSNYMELVSQFPGGKHDNPYIWTDDGKGSGGATACEATNNMNFTRLVNHSSGSKYYPILNTHIQTDSSPVVREHCNTSGTNSV